MSVSWSGQGLPPAAAERLASAGGSGTWTSALSTGEFAAIRSVGFEPVGQVMGSAVFHIGRSGRYWGYHDCQYPGARYSYAFGSRTGAPVALSGAAPRRRRWSASSTRPGAPRSVGCPRSAGRSGATAWWPPR